MKKLFLAITLTLSLAGCANLQTAFNVATAATVGINNPVTKDMLNNTENGAIIVFAGLGAYKKSCISGAIPVTCKDVIRKMQVYTRKLPPLLTSIRAFVKKNDQVNAAIAYNTIQQLIANFKAIATANNVQVQ